MSDKLQLVVTSDKSINEVIGVRVSQFIEAAWRLGRDKLKFIGHFESDILLSSC